VWNEPSKEELSRIPRLYRTEACPLQDKLIYLHFFIAGCDWYIAEYDLEDLFWGFTILNNDYLNAEWGYSSFSELKSLDLLGLEVDRELCWRIRPAQEVDKIVKAHSHWKIHLKKGEL
jgi:hypothetical protein